MATLIPELFAPGTWEAVSDLLGFLDAWEPLEIADKNSAPLFGPYDLTPGGTRKNESVTGFDFGVLDFDGPRHSGFAPDETLAILERLAGYDCHVATSHSNRAERATFRATLRLARRVAPSDWPAVWGMLRAEFPESDPHDSALAQAYFLPCYAPGREADFWAVRFEGSPWDPDGVPVVAPVAVGAPLTADAAPLPREALDRLIKRFRASVDTTEHSLGTALLAVRQGVAFAQPGARDNTLFAIVLALVTAFPNIDYPTLLSTLSLSLAATFPEGPAVDLAGKLDRARKFRKDSNAAVVNPNPETELPAAQIETVFASLGVSGPLKHLVLQRDTDYWVASYSDRYGLQYVPAKRDSLAKQAADKWGFAGVRLFTIEGDRTRKMRIDEIVDRYGTPIESLARSFCIERPEVRIDGATRELVIPAAKRRILKGDFNPEIHDWLVKLGGETILDWICLALDPSEQLAALVLIGAPGTGKSLLAKEIAKVWTPDAPPSLASAFGNFNSELCRCPILLSDEDIPRDLKGRVRTAEIREIIQRGRHPINAKYQTTSHLEGFPRVVITANNDTVLDFGADALTADDLAALQQRIHVIRVHPDCARILAAADVKRWIETEAIGRHAMWIAETRGTERVGRFGLKVNKSSVTSTVFGLRGAILEWLCKFFSAPGRVRTSTAVDRGRGVIRLRLQDLEQAWSAYSDQPRPTTHRLSRALMAYPGAAGWHEIPTLEIETWARETNYADPVEVRRWVESYSVTGSPLHAVK